MRAPLALDLPENAGVVVCNGGGVDSMAMLIALRDAGITPDLITFADTGGEKPETYQTVRQMDHWLIANGFPTVTWCKKLTLDSTPYDDLGGNCSHNETLPSLAFGMKSCSIKWKQGPQDAVLKGVKQGPNKRDPHPLWTAAQRAGSKLVKLIGYDSSPADLRRSKRVKTEDADFLYAYPLQDLGWQRRDCIARIIEEGLPVPIKSACFFCPASQKWELWALAGNHPHLFMEALAIEHRAMVGKHSRWDQEECLYDKSWEELINQPADQWPTTSITVGLGRSFAWNHWARENGLVCGETGRFIGNREHCLAMADKLRGDGGNASNGCSGLDVAEGWRAAA